MAPRKIFGVFMIIVAPQENQPYTIVSKSISENKALSWAARAVLIYLIGKPGNWHVSIADLTNQTAGSDKKTGRDGIYSIIGELVKAGYMVKQQPRGDAGKFESRDYVVYALPAEPFTVQPLTAQPLAANPTLVNNDLEQVMINNNNEKNIMSGNPDAIHFEPETKTPKCPTKQIIDLYHKKLPELPRCRTLRSGMEQHIAVRWKENKAHQTIEFWEAFFDNVRTNDWWMGRSQSATGGTFLVPGLFWLVKPLNFDKVISWKGKK